MREIHGAASHQVATPELDLALTARGGHLAPVVFHLPGRDVVPYALAPWQPAEFLDLPPLLSVLRGDFLCLPFGGQTDGPPHGVPANGDWSLLETGARSLCLEMALPAVQAEARTPARVEKILTVRPGQHAIFAEHRISNLEGNFNYGTHPILDLSGLPDGAGRVTTSAFNWASTFPGAFSAPAAGETQALAEGAIFSDLREVPLAAGGSTDLTRYPARPGNDDLVMMANAPATAAQPFAWSAVVLDGYLWFALKNPVDFPATLLWISHGGRSAPPWHGRHLGRIGVEEVCSYFSHGVAVSRQDLLAGEGIPTSRRFTRGETVSLRTIQGVALVPEDFGAVCGISPRTEGVVAIIGESGRQIIVALDWQFVV